MVASSSSLVASVAVPGTLDFRDDDLADEADEIHPDLEADDGTYTIKKPPVVGTHGTHGTAGRNGMARGRGGWRVQQVGRGRKEAGWVIKTSARVLNAQSRTRSIAQDVAGWLLLLCAVHAWKEKIFQKEINVHTR
jgi:hypothetical protein